MTAIMLDEHFGIRPASEAGPATIPAGQTAVGLAGLRVRQLGKSDLPAVERHLLDLGPRDRGARFLGYPSDAAIAEYVRGIDPSRAVLIGAFAPSDRMVGLAEAHPTTPPDTMEVAVSIDPAFRRCGLGQQLVAGALAVASDHGMQLAEFIFAPDNCALAGLVETLGGQIIAPGYASIDLLRRSCGKRGGLRRGEVLQRKRNNPERISIRSNHLSIVMLALVAGIHVFLAVLQQARRRWPRQSRP
jgi:GNAT superfamily N-acetyltransferase